ncbi:hypothetical protein QJS10_CPA06g00793 [Acorus calamus]|uniref:Uncharacterized protein n=1 Tax=Acorus calamus TaxID=4465 RepID=A0AAV9ENA5_ACOCL|nr:hypothetical protein QJS10_CPA06g00793 [Acorus calamus]
MSDSNIKFLGGLGIKRISDWNSTAMVSRPLHIWDLVQDLEVGGVSSDLLIWKGRKIGSMSTPSAWNILKPQLPLLPWGFEDAEFQSSLNISYGSLGLPNLKQNVRFGRTTRNAVALFSAYVKLIRSLDRQQEMHADDFLLKGLE